MNEKFFDLKKEKQDRMINAALKAFAVNGYKRASTDEIVKDAGISKGLLFHYFDRNIAFVTADSIQRSRWHAYFGLLFYGDICYLCNRTHTI